MGGTAEVLDGIVDMLSQSLKTHDLQTANHMKRVQRTYFHSFDASDLDRLHSLLASYTPEERHGCADLLLIIERELNDRYSSWLKYGTMPSDIPPHMVIKIIRSIPAMLALPVPLRSAHRVSVATYMINSGRPDESAEAFTGRVIAGELAGRTCDGYSPEHLEWIAANLHSLLPFKEKFKRARSVDRELCDRLIETHPSLVTGVL